MISGQRADGSIFRTKVKIGDFFRQKNEKPSLIKSTNERACKVSLSSHISSLISRDTRV